MTSVSRYDSSVSQTRFDALVIGSGIGGLGVAALLARHGQKVLVLERHSVPGGLTHTFRRQGFEWDVGLHYLGKVHDAAHPLRRVFDYVTDGALRWARLDSVYDTLVFDDARHGLPSGAQALEDSLCAAFPAERRGICAYLRRVQQVERTADRFFLQHVLPGWLTPVTHPLLGWPFLRHAERTTRHALRDFTSDERLAGVLAGQWGNHGLTPSHASFAMHALVAGFYLEGASYPVGGASSLARHILPVIERAGGQVRVLAEVQQILVRDGRAIGVRMANGDELLAPHVISGAGVHHTVNTLLPEPLRPRAAVEGLRTVRPSSGHVCLYLGLEGSARELGLSASHLWVHAGHDHDASVRASLADPNAPLPLVFISSPSAKDPEWQRHHPHRSTLSAVCPVPSAWFSPWQDTRWRRRGPEYEDFKARLSERVLHTVLQQLPQLRGRISCQEFSTPLSTQHFCNHPLGSMYGLEHSPARFRQRWLRPTLPVRNLFLVGQDVVSVGVGASLMSAVLTASVVLRRNVLGDALRAGPSLLLPQAA